MRFGFVVPHGNAREFADLAALGERAGWDGVFTADAFWREHAWVSLGAAAMMTERVRLGTLLTPASRWRPWDLASAVGTVDRLSGGRTVMSVGLGAVHEGWTAFEPDEGRRVRAEKLDECLAIYERLMRGQPFAFTGKHYEVKPTDHFAPGLPAQRPHPPVWVVGAWLKGRVSQPSLGRAARWDGLLPAVIEEGTGRGVTSPAELAALKSEVRALRAEAGQDTKPYDIVLEADSTGQFIQLDPPGPGEWAAAGATWWIESWWTIAPGPDGLAEVRRRIETGPPS